MTDAAAILELDDQRFKATIAADAATMEALFADELVYTHSNGLVDTKRSYIDAVVSKKFAYQDIRRFDQQVTIHGDSALIIGRAEIDVSGRSLNLRFLTVWVNQAGTWRFAGWQSTPIPA